MRMIGCVSPPTAGELSILGMDPVTQGREIRARLGVVPQEDTLDVELTVRENLLVYGRYFGLPREVIRERTARAAGVRSAQRPGRGSGRAAVGGHETAAHDRQVAHQRAGHPAAGRADHRAGPAGQACGLGPAVPAQAAGRHPGADHPLHGRGRAALRPAGGDGWRQDRGQRLAPGADRAVLHPRSAGTAVRPGRSPAGCREGGRRARRAAGGARRPDPAVRHRRRGGPGRGAWAGPGTAHLTGPAQHAGGCVPAADRPPAWESDGRGDRLGWPSGSCGSG